MAYIRVSIMRPDDHERDEVRRILDALSAYLPGQPGYVSGDVLTPDDDTGEIWRFSYWESEAAADRAAQDAHVMALRSQLLQLVSDDLHEERGFFTAS